MVKQELSPALLHKLSHQQNFGITKQVLDENWDTSAISIIAGCIRSIAWLECEREVYSTNGVMQGFISDGIASLKRVISGRVDFLLKFNNY